MGSEAITSALLYEDIFKFGAPRRLITENGSNLTSLVMKLMARQLRMRHSTTSVEHPQTDGLVERLNRTIKSVMAAYVEVNPTTWDDKLPFVTFAYNTAVRPSTKKSPFEVFFGKKLVIPTMADITCTRKTTYGKTWMRYLEAHLLIVRAEAFESRKAAQVKQKRLYDRTRRKAHVFKPGDYVPKKNSDE
jgi:transposase InsO family protein